MQRLEAGTLVITDRGHLVVLTTDGPVTEMQMQPNSPVRSFYEGMVLPTLNKFKGEVVRKVGHIDDIVLPYLKTIDTTPAVKENTQLTDRELLDKVLRENAELKKKFEQITSK